MVHCAEVVSYSGDVTAKDAWHELSSNVSAQLVDVRSAFEWSLFGIPDLTSIGKKALVVEWNTYPPFSRNMNFVQQLEAKLAGTDRNSPLYFVCRSGWRSSLAAEVMSRKGYKNCFNIKYGFEGVQDSMPVQGVYEGWKQSGLPWTLLEQEACAA